MAVPRLADKATEPRGRPRRRAPARRSYHHGDLRAALLAAAERELAANGVEGFTLRGCARRAGVSHAAPAHHFPDVRALLTEMAIIGFERLSASMALHARGLPPGSFDHILAIGNGYVAFAVDYPHLFRLIFRSALLDVDAGRFKAAGAAAFSVPVRAIGALYASDDPMADPNLATRVIAMWSIVHGFSELMLAGQFARGPGRSMPISELLATVIGEGFLPKPKGRRRGPRAGVETEKPQPTAPDEGEGAIADATGRT
jgi:AcrR family transcriptional regulator